MKINLIQTCTMYAHLFSTDAYMIKPRHVGNLNIHLLCHVRVNCMIHENNFFLFKEAYKKHCAAICSTHKSYLKGKKNLPFFFFPFIRETDLRHRAPNSKEEPTSWSPEPTIQLLSKEAKKKSRNQLRKNLPAEVKVNKFACLNQRNSSCLPTKNVMKWHR